MFRAYFSDLRTGRLARLPFLGFLLLLSVLFVLYGLGIAFGAGLTEHLIRPDFLTAPADLLEQIDVATLALLGPLVLVFGCAKANLLAKRIRDMGLPGWRTLLVIAIAAAGLGYAMHASGVPLRESLPIHRMIGGLLSLGLLLIPSGLFQPRPPAAHPSQPC
jgi:uncharacterized membrane protein YhaH (DUF805 family)